MANARPALPQDPCAVSLQSISFAALKNLIQNPRCNIRSVYDVLGKLPEDFMRNYMLFYRSRSLQGPHEVDYLNPRALVFTTDIKKPFILSFNGDPAQPGYKALEMVEIHPENQKNVFRYYEIEFPQADNEAHSLSWNQIQNGIHFSAANPKRCTACHGTTARPIMSGYPDWEGAFGSLHVKASPPEEQEGFSRYYFKVKNTDAGRYKFLGDIQGFMADSELDTLLAGRDFTNSDLHHLIGKSNAKRVGSLVQQTPDYAKMRYALTAAFAGCSNIPSYIPEKVLIQLQANLETKYKLRAKWQAPNIEAMYRKIYEFKRLFILSSLVPAQEGRTDATYVQYLTRARSFIGKGNLDYERLQLDTIQIQGIQRGDYLGGDLRLLMEGRGLQIDNWFTDLTQPTYRYHDGGDAAGFTAKAIVATDPTFDPTLKQMFAHKDTTGGMVGPELTRKMDLDRRIAVNRCSRLKELSLLALADFKVRKIETLRSAVHEDVAGYPKVFTQVCATCHSGSDAVCDQIPFANPADMALWIGDSKNLTKLQDRILSPVETFKMPPTEFLSDDDLNSILRYIGGSH